MDPTWVGPFLQALAAGSTVSEAAAAAGTTSAAVYQRRKANDDFKEAWRVALEDSADVLEREARRRAIDGVDEPVFHQGVICGHKRVYSDSLLSLLLKGRRKDVFSDRTELAGVPGQPIEIDETVRTARLAALLAAAKARSDMV